MQAPNPSLCLSKAAPLREQCTNGPNCSTHYKRRASWRRPTPNIQTSCNNGTAKTTTTLTTAMMATRMQTTKGAAVVRTLRTRRRGLVLRLSYKHIFGTLFGRDGSRTSGEGSFITIKFGDAQEHLGAHKHAQY